jgi:hypothetical protein
MRHPADFDLTNQPRNRHGYDPNQPRVPKGHHDGGQWTDGKDRQLSKLRLAFNDRDPSVRTSPPQFPSPSQPPRIPSPPLQPPAPNSPPQPWIPSRPSTLPRGGPLWGLLAGWLSRSESEILKRYNQFSEYNNGDLQAVLILGREFGRDPATGQFRLTDARMLTREEIDKLCDGGVEALQKIVDKAVEDAEPYRDQLSGSQYGTNIHSWVENAIKDPRSKFKGIVRDKGFKAEISFVKKIDEDGPPTYEEGDRGEKGSIRLDVLQPIIRKRTVCVHDLKTLRKGLSTARIRELGSRIFNNDEYRNKIDRVIVTESRPSDGWRMGRRPKP